jgi:hypothetical protein
MTTAHKAEKFVAALQSFPAFAGVFNPWADVDKQHDNSSRNPDIRAENLVQYLSERVGIADNVLIAEAPGYQGCHFSGIAMTSERILLGYQRHNNVNPEDVFLGPVTRTSKDEKLGGFNEPTATIVWKAIKNSGTDPRRVVLWNSFAFHPMKSGYLTNRKPTESELRQAEPLLRQFLELFPTAFVVPVGRVAEEILGALNVTSAPYVRHPANGGATGFRDGMTTYWSPTGTAGA